LTWDRSEKNEKKKKKRKRGRRKKKKEEERKSPDLVEIVLVELPDEACKVVVFEVLWEDVL